MIKIEKTLDMIIPDMIDETKKSTYDPIIEAVVDKMVNSIIENYKNAFNTTAKGSLSQDNIDLILNEQKDKLDEFDKIIFKTTHDKVITLANDTLKKYVKNFIFMHYDEIINLGNENKFFKNYLKTSRKAAIPVDDAAAIPEHDVMIIKKIRNKNKYVPFFSEVFNYNIMSKPLDKNDYKELRKHIMSKTLDTDDDITLRNRVMSLLDVDVCPYCNRQYITLFKGKNGRRSTADLDHFFVKSVYPIFALSFFNFIPACGTCNSTFKKDKFLGTNGVPPVYPGERGFGDDAVFEVNIDKSCKTDKEKAEKLLEIWKGGSPDGMEIKINNKNNDDAIESSVKIFGLNEVYESHKKYVSDILLKQRIFDSGDYKDHLESVLKNAYGKNTGKSDISKISPAEMQAFLYGFCYDNNSWNDSKRPLSKLTRDILEKKENK